MVITSSPSKPVIMVLVPCFTHNVPLPSITFPLADVFPLQQEVSFMPSVGVEFVTKMGVHVPQFVDAGLEMHTNVYHESSLRARLQIANNQIRLSMPAPEGPTQLFRVRYVQTGGRSCKTTYF